jgi:thioredoxin reductase
MASRIVVLGAGPIGVEAALLAAQRGHDVQIFERGQVGEHVARWSHVTLFSPWRLNRSPWGAALLAASGQPLDPDDASPTGADYLRRYLIPLSHHALLEGRIHTQTEVVGVARAASLKGERIGKRDAGAGELLVMVRDAAGAERLVHADLVIDATGTYSQPLQLGPGGLPALGERAHEDRITRYVPDLGAPELAHLKSERVLLIGGGHSAVTTLKALHEVQPAHGASTAWVLRADDHPYDIIEGDPLPQRVALARFGNAAAAGDYAPHIRPITRSHLLSIEDGDDGALRVTLVDHAGAHVVVEVDHIISNVGYRPDLSLTRELQIHHCYASEGPMKLAASLLSAGGGGDCLAQVSGGVDTLRSPERDVFVLGAKSYGRSSSILLKVGFEQIAQVFEAL